MPVKNVEKNVLIATYGSLRVGMQNFGINTAAGATLVGCGETVDNFDLFRYGGAYFPSVSLAHSKSNKPVVVDVFETTQEGLEGPYDMLEGHSPDRDDNFYNRTLVKIQMDSGEVLDAWIYHIDEEQPERVESGDWCLYNDHDYYKNKEEQND